MKNFLFRVTWLLAVWAVAGFLMGGAWAQATPPFPAQGKSDVSYLRGLVETRLVNMEAEQAKQKTVTISTRNLSNGAFAALVLGHEPTRAEALMRKMFALQDMDEKSPHYGEVPWQASHPEIVDRNAEVFTSQAIGPMLLLYGNELSPPFKAELRPHVQAFFAALKRRNMRTPAYTNIYVMRFVSMILMGEAVGDKAATAQGYAWLDEWLHYTKQAGVHEFNSPTYTAVDLNSLYLGYRFAQKPGAKAIFKAILNYFWTDAAANYFAGRGSYSGPHSRDYDFIGGWSGGMGYYYAAYGLRDDGTSDMLGLETVYPLFNTDAAAPQNYRPSVQILALARQKERIVQSRFDSDGFSDRMNYVTPWYAIGGTTGGYNGGQEKLVTVELASAKKLPVINIVPDVFDSPYGKIKLVDPSGHSKASRLPLNPVSVQSKNALLVLCAINPAKARAASQTISTSVLLPSQADTMLLNGKAVAASKVFQIPAKIGDTVAVREGRAGLVIRLVGAGGLQNQTPTVILQADADGLKEGVARLTVYHYRGAAEKQTADQLPVAFLLVADECANDAALVRLVSRVQAAPVSAQLAGAMWTASAKLAGSPALSAAWDTENKKVIHRRVGETNVKPFGPLVVNGEPVFDRTLGPLVPPVAP